MMGGCCGWGGGWWGLAGGGWLGMLFSLLFWVLIVVAVLAGLRWLLRSMPTSPAGGVMPAAGATAEDPKQVLQTRYARGEITREEYLRMLADLEGRPA